MHVFWGSFKPWLVRMVFLLQSELHLQSNQPDRCHSCICPVFPEDRHDNRDPPSIAAWRWRRSHQYRRDDRPAVTPEQDPTTTSPDAPCEDECRHKDCSPRRQFVGQHRTYRAAPYWHAEVHIVLCIQRNDYKVMCLSPPEMLTTKYIFILKKLYPSTKPLWYFTSMLYVLSNKIIIGVHSTYFN